MVEHLHRKVRPGRTRNAIFVPASRRRQRGSVVIVAMLVLVALISLGGLTVLSVQGSASATGADRFKAIALYAAESGASAAMDFMRKHLSQLTAWGAYVEPNNVNPQSPEEIPGNGILPGEDGNLFTPEMNAWYEITILNNPTDPSFAAGEDFDKRVIIRSTGHGPNGAVAQVEWEIT